MRTLVCRLFKWAARLGSGVARTAGRRKRTSLIPGRLTAAPLLRLSARRGLASQLRTAQAKSACAHAVPEHRTDHQQVPDVVHVYRVCVRPAGRQLRSGLCFEAPGEPLALSSLGRQCAALCSTEPSLYCVGHSVVRCTVMPMLLRCAVLSVLCRTPLAPGSAPILQHGVLCCPAVLCSKLTSLRARHPPSESTGPRR
jgi:hypothetical protein